MGHAGDRLESAKLKFCQVWWYSSPFFFDCHRKIWGSLNTPPTRLGRGSNVVGKLTEKVVRRKLLNCVTYHNILFQTHIRLLPHPIHYPSIDVVTYLISCATNNGCWLHQRATSVDASKVFYGVSRILFLWLECFETSERCYGISSNNS